MAANTEPTEDKSAASAPAKKRVRIWMCARIVDYRFQALALEDPTYDDSDHCWADVGPDTFTSDDREAVFQLARTHGGLLLGCDGLPNGARVAALMARVKAMVEAF